MGAQPPQRLRPVGQSCRRDGAFVELGGSPGRLVRQRQQMRVVETDHQRQVRRAEGGGVGQHRLGRVGIDQVGEQDHHCPFALLHAQQSERRAVARLDQSALDVVERLQQAVELRSAGAWRQVGEGLLREDQQADLVVQPQRDVGQHQPRADRVVEAGLVVDPSAHQSADIEADDHRLPPLDLVQPRDQSSPPGGRAPVDAAVLVIRLVVPQGLELRPGAAQPGGTQPGLQPPAGALGEIGTLERAQIGIDQDRLPERPMGLALEQPKLARPTERDAAKL